MPLSQKKKQINADNVTGDFLGRRDANTTNAKKERNKSAINK